jgi:hypothetical protein
VVNYSLRVAKNKKKLEEGNRNKKKEKDSPFCFLESTANSSAASFWAHQLGRGEKKPRGAKKK